MYRAILFAVATVALALMAIGELWSIVAENVAQRLNKGERAE